MSEEIGIATGLRPQPRSFPRLTGKGVGGEAVGAKLKGRVAEGEETEKLGDDRPAGFPLGDRAEALVLACVEPELGRGSGEIPGSVLAADEVVGGVMVERIGLDQPLAGNEPFPSVQAVVGADRADMAGEPGQLNRPGAKSLRGRVPEREFAVAASHGGELFERGTGAIRRKEPRARPDVSAEMLDEPRPILRNRTKRPGMLEPGLDREPVPEARDRRYEARRGELAGEIELVGAVAAEARKPQQPRAVLASQQELAALLLRVRRRPLRLRGEAEPPPFATGKLGRRRRRRAAEIGDPALDAMTGIGGAEREIL